MKFKKLIFRILNLIIILTSISNILITENIFAFSDNSFRKSQSDIINSDLILIKPVSCNLQLAEGGTLSGGGGGGNSLGLLAAGALDKLSQILSSMDNRILDQNEKKRAFEVICSPQLFILVENSQSSAPDKIEDDRSMSDGDIIIKFNSLDQRKSERSSNKLILLMFEKISELLKWNSQKNYQILFNELESILNKNKKTTIFKPYECEIIYGADHLQQTYKLGMILVKDSEEITAESLCSEVYHDQVTKVLSQLLIDAKSIKFQLNKISNYEK